MEPLRENVNYTVVSCFGVDVDTLGTRMNHRSNPREGFASAGTH